MPSASAAPLARPAAGHPPPATLKQGRTQSLPANANPMQRQAETPRRPQGHRPTLGELLARESRQDRETEHARQAYSALPHGGKVMQRLKDRAARQHPTTMAEKLHARLSGSPQPMEGKRKRAFAELVRADVIDLSRTGKIHPLRAVDTIRTAALEGPLGQGILEQDRKLLLDVLDQLDQMIIKDRYQKLNLKIIDETKPAFTDAHVLEQPAQLGSGSFNTVFALKIMDADGAAFDAVFKPLNAKDDGWTAGMTGIPEDDPQTAMRNIATVSYARKLGLHVVADTRVALIDTGRGPHEPTLGLMMERAQGKPAAQADTIILARPDVCAEVTKLQLLDHLTGQGDRHGNNFFIHVGPNGRTRVTGIDNDQCFGKELTDPAGIQYIGTPDREGFRGTGLPPIVDTRMEKSINALTETDIRSMLGDKLSKEEIDAAIQRHQGVKDHIAQLSANGKVIEPEQWNHPDVQQLLKPDNSYIGRERAKAQARQASLERKRNNAGAANHDTW
ncbi:hypothetical protein M5C99_21075 [Acidovorax sp. NCPPB 2350]|nr:hypothetical protein M5C99_21075 [Acidovorax sp. NCPPB 2350]